MLGMAIAEASMDAASVHAQITPPGRPQETSEGESRKTTFSIYATKSVIDIVEKALAAQSRRIQPNFPVQ
jgi:hypothetical protein